MKRSKVLMLCLAVAAASWGVVTWNRMRDLEELRNASRGELERRVRASPDDAEALARLGSLLLDDREPEAAAALLERAAGLLPDRPDVVADWIRALPDPSSAEALAARALELFPGDPRIVAERLRIRVRTGEAEAVSRDWQSLDEAMRSTVPLRRVHGEALLAAGRQSEAVQALESCLELEDTPGLRLTLVQALIPLQRYSDVERLTRPLIESSSSGGSEGLRLRASLYWCGARLFGPLSGRELETLGTRLDAARARPELLEPGEVFLADWFSGERWLRMGQSERSLPYLRRANELDPTFLGAWFSRARAARLAGKPAESRYCFDVHRKMMELVRRVESAADRAAQEPGNDVLERTWSGAADALDRYVAGLAERPGG